MKNVSNYKCPACGGGINFDPASGKVACEYCDSSFSIEEIEKIYGVQEDSAGESQQAEKPERTAEGFDSSEGKWNTDELSSDWGSDGAKMREYSCPSCGAAILCEETTAATSCPYCDNPTVIEKQFSGSLKPDYVIPFRLKKNDAIEKLKEFYGGKKILPKEFADENHLEEIKGVYVPFWFFDGTASGYAIFDTTTETRKRSGNKEIITTRHFECVRDGSLDFAMVPVDASKKMPDDMMDSLEPFDYSELKPFSTAYLPGFLADKHDVSVEDCTERADRRCAQTLLATLRSSVVGYHSVRLSSSRLNFNSGKVHYGLLPVYLLYTKWNETRYLFAVNGQTGKIAGTLPASGGRSFAYWTRNFLLSVLGFGAAAAGIVALIISNM